MDLTLPILIVSSTCLGGLLGLWAGASRRPVWYRVAVVVGVISLLLAIPAYELVVFFLLLAGLVAVATALYIRRDPGAEPTSSPRSRGGLARYSTPSGSTASSSIRRRSPKRTCPIRTVIRSSSQPARRSRAPS